MASKYIAKYQNESGYDDSLSSAHPGQVWSNLEKRFGKPRQELKKLGWRVKLKVDVGEIAEQVATNVILPQVEEVLPPKLGIFARLVKAVLGK